MYFFGNKLWKNIIFSFPSKNNKGKIPQKLFELGKMKKWLGKIIVKNKERKYCYWIKRALKLIFISFSFLKKISRNFCVIQGKWFRWITKQKIYFERIEKEMKSCCLCECNRNKLWIYENERIELEIEINFWNWK